MTNIEFEISKWDYEEKYYTLYVDKKQQLTKIPIGELRTIFNEMEKYARMRFKGDLSHKKKKVNLK